MGETRVRDIYGTKSIFCNKPEVELTTVTVYI